MTISPQAIANLYAQRVVAAGPDQARMREVQRMVDGEIVVPLPELNKAEQNFIPNRAAQGLQQFAQRIASVLPNLYCPALRPGITMSENRAHDRRRAILGWWGHSKLEILLRQRARYLQGYAKTPVQIRWDADSDVPVWEVRNPLTTYPAMLRGPQDLCPCDCIFETVQSLGWLTDRYPTQTAMLAKPTNAFRDGLMNRDLQFTLLEYVDAGECVLVVLGQKADGYTPSPGSMVVELERYENRSGRCPVVYPHQIVLSKLRGQFDGMAGMHQMEAKLAALSAIATQRGVMGQYWLVARQNEQPEILQTPKDDGTVGMVKGADLQRIGVDPQFQTNIMMDRLAANQMETAGLSSELSGLSPTNVRTGVRAQNLLANVIDFPIQEAQELLEESLQEENKIAVAYTKAYGGKKTFYVAWPGARGLTTYDAATTFDTDENLVEYPMTGADQAGLVISGGQRVQMGTLSKQEFMQIDPLVKDPVRTHDLIVGERLEQAVLASLEQQANSGTIEAVYVAKIAQWVVSNDKDLYQAIDDAHTEAQQQQAQQAPPGAPAAMPGLTGPAQAQTAPTAPPDLATMLAQLRRPQTGETPQEQMAGAAQ